MSEGGYVDSVESVGRSLCNESVSEQASEVLTSHNRRSWTDKTSTDASHINQQSQRLTEDVDENKSRCVNDCFCGNYGFPGRYEELD
ncbi:hypothetical protein Y032_0148g2645 [Ancylostoma ceylanicum]|uniref:Uncharacterized protein n=1 Tax=Ancylostoma ceylanicum TaxID=53326 RepID=A0A016T247_9BILA|nr:hypothetical protein Y032_0148g2645 [Ancylostoma ceylanicum]